MNRNRDTYPFDHEATNAAWFVVDQRTLSRVGKFNTQTEARTERDKRNLAYWATIDANARRAEK